MKYSVSEMGEEERKEKERKEEKRRLFLIWKDMKNKFAKERKDFFQNSKGFGDEEL